MTTAAQTWTGSTQGVSGIAGAARRILATSDDRGATVARLALGAVMLPHAAQKVFGWFGGYGLSGTLGFFTHQMGLPYALAVLVVAFELLGALSLLSGLAGRLGAAAIAAVMVGAIATVHAANGFFMNWSGSQAGEGFEYHVLAIALAAVVMLRGSGAASIDRLLTKRG